jgi:hypothetical protein
MASYHFYFDNFFTGLPLLSYLSDRGCKATGTIRENRTSKCPLSHSKKFSKFQKGTYERVQDKSGSLCLVRWSDSGSVTVASNHYTEMPLQDTSRWNSQQKERVTIPQPYCIYMYNQYMGGVDRCDQNMSHYQPSIRGRKWWFPVFIHLINLAIQNAWQLHRRMAGSCNEIALDQLEFRRHISQYYCNLYSSISASLKSSRAVTSAINEVRFDKLDHIVEYCEKEGRCAQCNKNGRFICRRCQVILHPKACFFLYHTPTTA